MTNFPSVCHSHENMFSSVFSPGYLCDEASKIILNHNHILSAVSLKSLQQLIVLLTKNELAVNITGTKNRFSPLCAQMSPGTTKKGQRIGNSASSFKRILKKKTIENHSQHSRMRKPVGIQHKKSIICISVERFPWTLQEQRAKMLFLKCIRVFIIPC